MDHMNYLISAGLFVSFISCKTALPPTYALLNPEEFEILLKGQEVILLDVRTPAETTDGQMSGAINLDYREDGFADALSSLDREQVYGVYCAGGMRSGKTLEMMKDLGFLHVYDLEGGYNKWLKFKNK